MLNMAIRGESDKQKRSETEMHVSGDYHHAVGASVHAWSATDPCRRINRPPIDWKAGLRQEGFSSESASRLCTGQIPPA
jgi:hypothetical protein